MLRDCRFVAPRTSISCPAGARGVGSSLVGDLPPTIDPQQRVEVNPRAANGIRRHQRIVEAEQHVGNVARLGYRDNSSNDCVLMWTGPSGETVCNQILVKDAVCVSEEDPGVFGKRFLELVDVALIERIDIQLNNSNDLVIVRRPVSHAWGSLATPTTVARARRHVGRIGSGICARLPSRTPDTGGRLSVV